jgi:LPXTG-motif cell wall-anchored protein
MRRAAIRLVLCGALVCLTAAAASAQTTTTSETKKFQIISVDGNTLVVKLPEGTREMAVADDFRFNVDGKMLSVQELRPGMSGTATITTRTTVTPVVVTEVKNGTVMQNLGTSILVRTEDGMKMFSQADIDKRGIKIWREGKLAEISDFRANDKLSATIVTTKPPRVMTEREVNATLAQSGGAAGAGVGAGAGAGAPAAAPRPGASTPPTGAASATSGTSGGAPRKLPKTASPLPVLALTGFASLLAALALTVRRRRATP